MRRSLTVLAAALALVVAGLAASGWAQAAAELGFQMQPPAGSPAATEGYYLLPADPGTRIDERLTLQNTSTEAIDILLAPVDASTGPYGGVSYGTPGSPVKQVGTWIALSQSRVRLGAGQAVDVPFTVSVPSDAAPGDHLAGIAAWIPAKESPPAGSPSPGGGVAVTVQMRRVLAVQVVVSGSAEAKLAVDGVKALPQGNGMNLGITIANTGQLLTQAKGIVTLPDTGFKKEFNVNTFVPGTSIEYPVLWTADPSPGTYQAHVVLRYGDKYAQTAEWSGEYTVVEENLKELENRVAATNAPAATTATGGASWLLYAVIGGLVFIILVMAVIMLRRRPAARS